MLNRRTLCVISLLSALNHCFPSLLLILFMSYGEVLTLWCPFSFKQTPITSIYSVLQYLEILSQFNTLELTLCVRTLSFLALVAVHAVEFLLLVREPREAYGGLSGTAAPAWTWDGVPHATVRQPARVTAIVAQQLPRRVHLTHFSDLSAVFFAGLHRFVVRELGRVYQVVETSWRKRWEMLKRSL